MKCDSYEVGARDRVVVVCLWVRVLAEARKEIVMESHVSSACMR